MRIALLQNNIVTEILEDPSYTLEMFPDGIEVAPIVLVGDIYNSNNGSFTRPTVVVKSAEQLLSEAIVTAQGTLLGSILLRKQTVFGSIGTVSAAQTELQSRYAGYILDTATPDQGYLDIAAIEGKRLALLNADSAATYGLVDAGGNGVPEAVAQYWRTNDLRIGRHTTQLDYFSAEKLAELQVQTTIQDVETTLEAQLQELTDLVLV